MTIVDVNILMYVVNSQSAHHKIAKKWWESALSQGEDIGLAWNVVLAFVRLATQSFAGVKAIPTAEVFDLVEGWLDVSTVFVIEPGPRHLSILRDLLLQSGTAGNLTADAHLAALAIELNAGLYSFDRDFARFSGLRWHDPLGR